MSCCELKLAWTKIAYETPTTQNMDFDWANGSRPQKIQQNAQKPFCYFIVGATQNMPFPIFQIKKNGTARHLVSFSLKCYSCRWIKPTSVQHVVTVTANRCYYSFKTIHFDHGVHIQIVNNNSNHSETLLLFCAKSPETIDLELKIPPRYQHHRHHKYVYTYNINVPICIYIDCVYLARCKCNFTL